MYKDNLDDFDRVVTLDELRIEVDEEYNNMSEDEKYRRLRDNEPTFLQYCCSLMGCSKIEKAVINEYTYKFEKNRGCWIALHITRKHAKYAN